MTKSISNRIARAQGCLMGQLVGDSLGGLVEFQTRKEISEAYPNGVRELADGGTWNTIAGQPTDDSEMALTLAWSMVAQGQYDRSAVRRSYKAWLASEPFDCGRTIRAGLSGRINPDSESNGALMRVAPLGIYGARYSSSSVYIVAEMAKEDARLTHVNQVCTTANQIMAYAISRAIRCVAETPNAYVFGLTAKWVSKNIDCPEALRTLREAEYAPPENYVEHQGHVLIAFQNAFYQLANAPSVEEGIVDTISRGGDTDTNAAICGALMGAVYGIGAFPKRWIDVITNCRPKEGQPGVHRPRPEIYWPCDALSLAEKLVRL